MRTQMITHNHPHSSTQTHIHTHTILLFNIQRNIRNAQHKKNLEKNLGHLCPSGGQQYEYQSIKILCKNC